MRWVGVDVGKRRIGLAMSDDSGTLARPWVVVPAGATTRATVDEIARQLRRFERESLEEDAFAGIVVGLPRRLGGEDTDQTPLARALAAALAERTGLGVHLQDERLTSREAESRLAERERDWRVRKTQIDAVAASIILQDFLDERQAVPVVQNSDAP
jgi:putative Holliday junction resolvase